MNQKDEIESVRTLGKLIGYGNIMDIASALWGIDLNNEYDEPVYHASIPTNYFSIKRRAQVRLIKHIEMRVREIKDAQQGREE